MPTTFMGVKYEHLVWNRTDLLLNNGVVGYEGALPPLVNEQFPPDPSSTYKGETIPAFAAMRVINNPIIVQDGESQRICWPVCRPDDQSFAVQARGFHFINGPTSIPLGGMTEATNQLPCPALVDVTVDQPTLYGNVGTIVPNSQTANGFGIIGNLLGYVSGSWALHPAGDIILGQSIIPQNMFSIANFSLPGGGSGNLLVSSMPYVVIGQHPMLNFDLPKGQFEYSGKIFWIGEGAIGFGSVVSD
jgi:hypothetical protein